MKKKELIIANEASDRIIHRLNGRIYGLERMVKELVYIIMECRNEFHQSYDQPIMVLYLEEAIKKMTGKTIEDLLNGEKDDN